MCERKVRKEYGVERNERESSGDKRWKLGRGRDGWRGGGRAGESAEWMNVREQEEEGRIIGVCRRDGEKE